MLSEMETELRALGALRIQISFQECGAIVMAVKNDGTSVLCTEKDLESACFAVLNRLRQAPCEHPADSDRAKIADRCTTSKWCDDPNCPLHGGNHQS